MSKFTLTRRNLVAGAASESVVALPAATVAAPLRFSAELMVTDPIYAAIIEHRQAYIDWEAAVHRECRFEDTLPARIGRLDPRMCAFERETGEASDRMAVAASALRVVRPTTGEGVIALLEYFSTMDDDCYHSTVGNDEYEQEYSFALYHNLAAALRALTPPWAVS